MGTSASKTARSYPARPSSAVLQNGAKAPHPQAQPESLKSRLAESRRTEGKYYLANLSGCLRHGTDEISQQLKKMEQILSFS